MFNRSERRAIEQGRLWTPNRSRYLPYFGCYAAKEGDDRCYFIQDDIDTFEVDTWHNRVDNGDMNYLREENLDHLAWEGHVSTDDPFQLITPYHAWYEDLRFPVLMTHQNY